MMSVDLFNISQWITHGSWWKNVGVYVAGIYERAQFHADPNKNLYPADLEYALIQGGFF